MLDETTSCSFPKYFTLEEAAGMIGEVRLMLKKAQEEIEPVKDELVLYKRLLNARQRSGKPPSKEQLELLHQKYEDLDHIVGQWIETFMDHGIVLRDVSRGLIDFPYQSKTSGEVYLLCWHLGDDGLFYFHGTGEGFVGRKPITLLPE